MQIPTWVAFLLPALAAATPLMPTTQEQQGPTVAAACEDVHMFIARGSGEPYPGRQGDLAENVCSKLQGKSCGYEDVPYPASYDNYCGSAWEGVKAGKKAIKDYANRCPKSKIVLTGYSQGAHVMGDILGGGGGDSAMGCFQEYTEPLKHHKKAGKSIAAVTLFGDARHAPSQSYNILDGKDSSGMWARGGEQLTKMNKYSDDIRSWCLAADPVCAQGPDGNMHTVYFDWYGEDAANWIVGKL